jgi:hypothetical protein
MAVVNQRIRPLVAVLARVPLFVEAMTAAFEGIADVQPVAVDDAAAFGLLRAFKPSAVIVEGVACDEIDVSIPCVHVELERQQVTLRRDGAWETVDVELSPEAIRNVAVAAVYGGEIS